MNELSLYKKAYVLSIVTILYNILEGLISVILGYKDRTLALFGFGIDSFIEVLSALGIAVMILHMWRNRDISKNRFEIKALDTRDAGT